MFTEVSPSDLPHGIDNLLNKAKGALFFNQNAGFLAPLLAKLRFGWTRDISTACIGDKGLWWNPDFFMALKPEQRITVLAHELWHNALMHGVRMTEMRCPDVWNKAGDHVINLMLEAHGYVFGDFPSVITGETFKALMDPQFKGMSTDEIYDILVKQGGKPMSSPNGPPKPGQPDPSSVGQQPERKHGQPGMDQDVLPVAPEAAYEAVADVVAAITAAGIAGMKPGTLPGEITLTIDRFLNPKLPWEVILFNFFNALTSDEYSFTRPNRRYDDPMVPGITGRNGLEHLVYYLDISGSITDDHILRFNSEVKFIHEELRPEKLTLVTFDTKVRDIYEFERDDPFEKVVVTGRGGTDLRDVFEHMSRIQPTAAIVFTDLEVGIPPDPGIPLIWVCIENPKKGVPYGTLIHLSERKNYRMESATPDDFIWGPDSGAYAN